MQRYNNYSKRQEHIPRILRIGKVNTNKQAAPEGGSGPYILIKTVADVLPQIIPKGLPFCHHLFVLVI